MTDLTRQDILQLARQRAAERFDRADWTSAERDYQLLVRLDGTCADDFARLGVAKMQRGRVGDGAICLSHALDIDPDHGPARVHFAEALIKLGNIRDGIVELTDVWSGRETDDPGSQAPCVKRAAAILAVARYAAEKVVPVA
jgi:predicted Zn-dependent protease